MADSRYTVADYTTALQASKPRGRAWPREADAVQTSVFTGLAHAFADSDLRAQQLLEDAFPVTTTELLPEWEATLGLPNKCSGLADTLQQRRNHVVAKFAGQGGQSAPYFTAFAANLGFTITVSEFAPFRAGFNRAGQPALGIAWSSAWQVNAPLETLVYFRAGISAADEPLAAWGNAMMECELSQIAPAHSTLLFSYT